VVPWWSVVPHATCDTHGKTSLLQQSTTPSFDRPERTKTTPMAASPSLSFAPQQFHSIGRYESATPPASLAESVRARAVAGAGLTHSHVPDNVDAAVASKLEGMWGQNWAHTTQSMSRPTPLFAPSESLQKIMSRCVWNPYYGWVAVLGQPCWDLQAAGTCVVRLVPWSVASLAESPFFCVLSLCACACACVCVCVCHTVWCPGCKA